MLFAFENNFGPTLNSVKFQLDKATHYIQFKMIELQKKTLLYHKVHM